MMKNLKTLLDELLEARTNEVFEEQCADDAFNSKFVTPEYKKVQHESCELYHKVEDLLTEEGKDLMRTLNEIDSKKHELGERSMYKQGFSDGFEFYSTLKNM